MHNAVENALAEIIAAWDAAKPGVMKPAIDAARAALTASPPLLRDREITEQVVDALKDARAALAMLFAKEDTPQHRALLACDRAIASVTVQENVAYALPLKEWSEDMGDVLWWCFRDGAWLGEAPYVGSPLDLGQTVEIELRSYQGEFVHQHNIGGWPGYHTHWTPLPAQPAALHQGGK